MTKSMKEEFESFAKKKSIIVHNYVKPIIDDIEQLNHINIIKTKNNIIFGI